MLLFRALVKIARQASSLLGMGSSNEIHTCLMLLLDLLQVLLVLLVLLGFCIGESDA